VHLFGFVTGTRVYVLCVVKFYSVVKFYYVGKLYCVVENLVGRRKEKGRKEQVVCFVLNRGMQGDLFIPESWMEVATWVEQIQLVAMEITKGKPS
jgi:hypothetical protein